MPRAALLALALLFVADWRAVSGAPCEAPHGCDANFQCNELGPNEQIPKARCVATSCEEAIQGHIQHEFNAAFTYLVMGAHFAQESVNRPGIAKFLLGAASEERSHAILMLDYLNKRGIKVSEANNNFKYQFDNFKDKLNKLESIDYENALKLALNMELDVTSKIYHVIKKCSKEGHEDYHGADVFTNPILDEQHEGVRHLQGAIKVFNNLAEGAETEPYKKYAEYVFDMKLLKGEIAAH